MHLPILAEQRPLFELPLLYGMQYSGCCLSYRLGLRSDRKVSLTSITPRRSSRGWPYEHYPTLLPYVPLSIKQRRRMSYRAFARGYPNLSNTQPASLVVVVPPPSSIGVSLWGPVGDAEEVTIVFECDVARETVKAYNICT